MLGKQDKQWEWPDLEGWAVRAHCSAGYTVIKEWTHTSFGCVSWERSGSVMLMSVLHLAELSMSEPLEQETSGYDMLAPSGPFT